MGRSPLDGAMDAMLFFPATHTGSGKVKWQVGKGGSLQAARPRPWAARSGFPLLCPIRTVRHLAEHDGAEAALRGPREVEPWRFKEPLVYSEK